ncbi:hypothetical protein [Paraburkholderia sp.]|uniref:hypothetical protein n=1 Tax=Paraburkholderia sp. TaxID=1926495 RepID=UPI0025E3F0FA|nr:hypothetical protein [Paraburkholderia sp.]
MSGNDDSAAIEPVRDGSRPDGISGISTAPPPDPQQDIRQDFGSSWIQRATLASTQMHRDEAFRRKVAKGLF